MSENQIPHKIPVPPNVNIPPKPTMVEDKVLQSNKESKTKSKREPLSEQSKTILFGLLGIFSLLGGLALLIVMLVI